MSTEEELRSLCLQVLQAETSKNLEDSLRTLRIALNEHFLDAENLAIHLILKKGKEIPVTLDKGDERDGTEG